MGMLVPESYQLFVCPFACGRHGAIGAIKQGLKDRLSYLYIDETDIVSGSYEELIVEACAKHGIPAHGISPKGKGRKVDADRFHAITGWSARCNQHERDAAMVAWPFRNHKDKNDGRR